MVVGGLASFVITPVVGFILELGGQEEKEAWDHAVAPGQMPFKLLGKVFDRIGNLIK